MILFALLIGIYSYIIFFLGILKLLYPNIIFITSLIYFISIIYWKRGVVRNFIRNKLSKKITNNFNIIKNKFGIFILFLITLQAMVNFIGVLGPELAFDSLWYHLTLPKMYLENHSVFYIPGGLLYYSVMPKLAEMYYIAGLAFNLEFLPRLLHFTIGILTLYVIYKLSRNFVSVNYSLLACLIFYSNLVVGWISFSSYVDLFRAFFEILAFLSFYLWTNKKNKKYFFLSAVFLGFAITVKLISILSLLIYLLLIAIIYRNQIKLAVLKSFQYIIIAIFIPLPWFIFAFINTGNPFYPFFSMAIFSGQIVPITNFLNFPNDMYRLFVGKGDLISPVYLVLVILIIFKIKKLFITFKLFFLYIVCAFLIWYVVQYASGVRLLVPYITVFSVFTVILLSKVNNNLLQKFLILIILIISIYSIVYRSIANFKFVPYILGYESKNQFLKNRLNFNFADFYDVDGYFAKNIKNTDVVLLYGFHNLYYVNFKHIDSSWVKKGDNFNYIAIQNSTLPKRFSNWKLVYYNKITNVKLYKLGDNIWVY